MSAWNHCIRWAFRLCLGLSIPACGSYTNENSTEDPAADSSALVFDESFAAPFPGIDWVYLGGVPSRESTLGQPPPALALAPSAPGITLQNVRPFPVAQRTGVAYSVDIAQPFLGTGTLTFHVRDPNATSGASVTIFADTGLIQYKIAEQSITLTEPRDPLFHTYAFVLQSDGSAIWLRDGREQFRFSVFPNGTLGVIFEGPRQPDTSTFLLDNIRVHTLD